MVFLSFSLVIPRTNHQVFLYLLPYFVLVSSQLVKGKHLNHHQDVTLLVILLNSLTVCLILKHKWCLTALCILIILYTGVKPLNLQQLYLNIIQVQFSISSMKSTLNFAFKFRSSSFSLTSHIYFSRR